MNPRIPLLLAVLAWGAVIPDAASAEEPAVQEKQDKAEKALPSAEELDREIEKVALEMRRAGNTALHDRLQARLADLWILRARVILIEGDEDGARRAYEDALSLSPLHRMGLLELGWLSLRLGQPARAESLARDGLAAHSEDPEFALLLGEVLYRDGKIDQALVWFEQAQRALPQDQDVAKKVEKLKRELAVEKNHSQRVTPRFALSFDGERDESLLALLEPALTEACDDLSREMGIIPREPIPVVLYAKKEFHETTTTVENVLGLFDGKVRLPVGGLEKITPGMVRVIRHELVHALLHSQGIGKIPIWLHEGLAQWFEPRDPLTGHRAALKETGETPLDLEPFSYPKSFSFTAFLVDRHSLNKVLWLSAELAKMKPEDDAFLRALGEPREVLIEEWRSWLASLD